jgi:polysaccharide export outer membrane protein
MISTYFTSIRQITLSVAAFAILSTGAAAQSTAVISRQGNPDAGEDPKQIASVSSVPSLYVLGPDDQIIIQGLHADELVNKPIRVDQNGEVNLPLVGVLHAGGLTVRSFESELNQTLAKYVRSPSLTVSITEPKSQPVFVNGAVNSPGVHQIQGNKDLVEMITLAGGLRQDAGYSVEITRQMKWGILPLPNAKADSTGMFSSSTVSIKAIMSGAAPAENIPVMPHDVISVPKAQMVYVIGEVRKPGGYVLGDSQTVSVLQALAMAEGLEKTAAGNNAKVIRRTANGDSRTEIKVDVKKILAGKADDFQMQGQDILSIPGNTGKKAALRAIELAIQTGSGVVVYGASRY